MNTDPIQRLQVATLTGACTSEELITETPMFSGEGATFLARRIGECTEVALKRLQKEATVLKKVCRWTLSISIGSRSPA